MINVIGGTLHRLFNGIIYSKMYANVATEVVLDSKCCEDQFSKMLVRAELVKEYITFFKERLPEVMCGSVLRKKYEALHNLINKN